MQTRLSSSGAVAAVLWWLLVLQPPRVKGKEKELSRGKRTVHGTKSGARCYIDGAGETSDIRDTGRDRSSKSLR